MKTDEEFEEKMSLPEWANQFKEDGYKEATQDFIRLLDARKEWIVISNGRSTNYVDEIQFEDSINKLKDKLIQSPSNQLKMEDSMPLLHGGKEGATPSGDTQTPVVPLCRELDLGLPTGDVQTCAMCGHYKTNHIKVSKRKRGYCRRFISYTDKPCPCTKFMPKTEVKKK